LQSKILASFKIKIAPAYSVVIIIIASIGDQFQISFVIFDFMTFVIHDIVEKASAVV